MLPARRQPRAAVPRALCNHCAAVARTAIKSLTVTAWRMRRMSSVPCHIGGIVSRPLR